MNLPFWASVPEKLTIEGIAICPDAHYEHEIQAYQSESVSRRYKSSSPNLGVMRERIVRELHAEIPLKRPGFVQ